MVIIWSFICYYFAFYRVLLLAKGTGIHKSFLVPLFALQAPSSAISSDTAICSPTYPMVPIPDVRSEYGLWTAFLGLLVRLFFSLPGRVTRKIHRSCLKSSRIPCYWDMLLMHMHAHLSVAGELELPLSTMLLVTVAPYQLMNMRYQTFSLWASAILLLLHPLGSSPGGYFFCSFANLILSSPCTGELKVARYCLWHSPRISPSSTSPGQEE